MTEQREKKKNVCLEGPPLVGHLLRLFDPNIRGPGLIPGRGTRSHMLLLRLKIPCATIKNQHSQINRYFNNNKILKTWLKCLLSIFQP